MRCKLPPYWLGDINQKRENLYNFVMEKGLILNRGTRPTFKDSKREKVIDITISTEGVAGMVENWRVLNKPSGSDHSRILFTLRHISKEKWIHNPKKN